jgi:hypothetical protein
MRRVRLFKAFLLAFLAAVFLLASTAAESQATINFNDYFITREQRIEDFNYMFDIISKNYPYFWIKQRLGYDDWAAKKEIFKQEMADADTPLKYYMAIQDILTALHNRHCDFYSESEATRIAAENEISPWASELKKALPAIDFWNETRNKAYAESSYMVSYYLNGHYYMKYELTLKDGRTIPATAEIVGLEGFDINKFIARNFEKLYMKKDPVSGGIFADNLFEAVKGEGKVFVDLKDPEFHLWISNDDITDSPNICFRSFRFKASDENIMFADLIPGQVAMVKIITFRSESAEKDTPALKDFLKNHNNYKAIIIDVRRNPGGSTDYWAKAIVAPTTRGDLFADFFIAYRSGGYGDTFAHFIHDMLDPSIDFLSPSEYPSAAPPEVRDGRIDKVFPFKFDVTGESTDIYPPKIYILTSRNSYSAAEAFSAFAKATSYATLVGEQTGGDGIAFSPVPIVLPNSLLAIKIPMGMGLDPTGAANEEVQTTPDIVTTWTIDDWRNYCDAYNNVADIAVDDIPLLPLEYDVDVKAVLKDLGITPPVELRN